MFFWCRQDQKGTGGTEIYCLTVGGVRVRRCALRGVFLMWGIGSDGFSLKIIIVFFRRAAIFGGD